MNIGDTLESIREFDPETQTSISTLDSVTVYPRKELILNNKERELLIDKINSSDTEIPEKVLSQINDTTVHDTR